MSRLRRDDGGDQPPVLPVRVLARGPVTVAFGSRDLLLRRRSRRVDQLPPGARVVAALPGCGHVPMADDPAAVAAFVTAGAARGSRRA